MTHPPLTAPPYRTRLASSDSAAARLTAPMLWAAGLLAAVAVLHVRDPHVPGSYAFCPWLLLTGMYCPGCGGLRAVHDLSHGEVAEAASSNLLVVGLAPLAALLWLGWVRARRRGRPLSVRLPVAPGAVLALAAVVGFTVLRNLDAAGWLAP